MIRNYLKTAVRNFLRNKIYGSMNIFGLAMGITCAGLIFLWVEDELKFDSFNEKKEQLYFARMNTVLDNGVFTHWSTPGTMGPAMKSEIPGVANSCRMTEDQTNLLFRIGDKSVYSNGKYVEASIFDMFTLPFAQGNAATAFKDLYSLVITEKTAKKFFPAADLQNNYKELIGKPVRADNKQDYIISGVIKDIPENSSLQFEWIAPFEIFYKASPWAWEWGNSCVNTYVELKKGANLANVNKQLYGIIQKRVPASNSHPFLFNMMQWHLHGAFENGKPTGGGQIQYIRLFSTIAWIILFIACINFMNLATARSEKRAKEVGVRKVLGAVKKKLIFQFISESLLMAMIAGVLAILIIFLALPAFNNLVDKHLLFNLANPLHLGALFLVTVVCGLVAGSYPSLYLSSFNPVFILKGIKLKSGTASLIRKGLVVTQFSVSIILIISTIIIFQQIQHVKSRNLGFNKDNLFQMTLQGDMLKNMDVIKHDLINTGVVENTALASTETIYGGNNTTDISWDGKDPNSQILISQRLVSPEYVSVSGMKIADGRDFMQTDIPEISDDFQLKNPDQAIRVIITESLAKLLTNSSAIGKTLTFPGPFNQNWKLVVVGVVNDYVYGNMYEKPDPVLFFCTPKFTGIMYVRTKPTTKPEEALAKIGAVMKKYNPSYPFEYKFVDDQFNNLFLNEMLISKLSRIFASLAIIISCLGLFGLSAYRAERRKKEIGIRKVLGANVGRITALLSKDFLILVGLAAVFAFPVSWWVMHNWLQEYNYRITINWWVFGLAGLLAVVIALLTISFQSIRAAVANPVNSLRSE